jgi:hypothetical protein
MKSSRRRGATLGLVAACVLVIIVLGVGVFFLAKMFGGGKEVANATDAGTLNLTKQALISPTITLPSSAVNLVGSTSPTSENGAEFIANAYPPPPTGTPPTINLFTYNRCVAQALMVALNAQQEQAQGSATAVGYAQQVYQDLQTYISQPLQQALIAGGNAANPNILQNNFSSGANKNNVHMYGDTTVNPTGGYQVAYLTRQGSNSTNVAIDPTILPAMPTSNNLATTANGQPGAIAPVSTPGGITAGSYFIGGYVPITAAGINFYGVPTYPGQQPHLVAGQQFQAALNPPQANVPPNAFQMAASAQMGTSGRIGGAFASAIVGAVAGGPFSSGALGSNNGVFTASIASGYIEMANLPGTIPGPGFMPTDEQTSIFNNELGNGNMGTPVVASSDGTMFALDNGSPASPQQEVNAWVAYNTISPQPAQSPAQAPASYVTPPLTVLVPAVPGNIYDSATGAQKNISALTTAVNFSDNCTAEAQTTTGLTTNCLNALNSGGMENAFGRATNNSGTPTGSPNGNGIAADDWIKGKVIQNFNSGYHPNVSISSASIPYQTGAPLAVPGNLSGSSQMGGGMGVYAGNTTDVYPSPGVATPASLAAYTAYPAEQETPSYCTVWNLINQVDHGNGTNNESPAGPTEGLNSGAVGGGPDGAGQGCLSVFDSLLQRAREIQPSTTPDQLRALLQSRNAYCPINTTLYLYLPPTAINNNIPDSTQPLMISSTKPASYTGASPDGAVGASSYSANCYDAAYSLVGQSVDIFNTESISAPEGTVSIKGDDALHEAPYTQISGNFMSQDSIGWTASSGYGNLLGRMVFANSVQGAASFSAPN